MTNFGRVALITGGAGFIGRATGSLLIEKGWRVIALDILDPQIHGGVTPEMPDGVELIVGDVLDGELLSELIPSVDSVLHLAARTGVGQSMYDIAKYVETNIAGTASLLERLIRGSQRIQRLVVASSRAVYGEGAYRCDQCGGVCPTVRSASQLEHGIWDVLCPVCRNPVTPSPTHESKPLSPGSIYAITKRDQEEMCLCVGRAYGIPTLALRYFNVYGEGQPLNNPYTGVIPAFASHVLAGKQAEVYEDGMPLRDFVHVNDIAAANVLALESEVTDSLAINIGAAEPITILEAASLITSVLGGEKPPTISGKYRIGDTRHCYGDTKLAESILSYRPSVSFNDGIRGMADWLKDQYQQDNSHIASSALEALGLLRSASVS